MKYLPLQEDTGREMEANLTPLIDVVFIILIMFIVIAPLMEIDRIELAQGKPLKQHAPMHQKSITIHVRSDNTILINHRSVKKSELKHVLSKLYKVYPNQTPQIFHDKRAHFGVYQTIKTALEQTGFEKMDIILEND